jgi:predicted Zn-dependent peptidase
MKSRIIHATALALLVAAPLAGQGTVDRSKQPAAGPAVTVHFPTIERRTLSNGIGVAVFENHELPIVSVQAVVNADGLLDSPDKDGLVAVLQQMLSEGTMTRTADQLAAAFADLGNSVSAMGFTTITPNVDSSLMLMGDMLMHPAFPEASLDRIRANQISALKRAQEQPAYIAQRVFANAVYGTGHPFERVRTEASLNAITRQALLDFHDTYYRPQNVQIVIAGDIKPDVAVAKLEKVFGTWAKGGKKTEYDVPAVAAAAPTTIYLYNRPGSPQSVLMAGDMGPQRDNPDYYALLVMNADLGGMFDSRINLDLREKHAYTYGANSGYQFRRVPMPSTFTVSSSVTTAKTDSSVMDLMQDIRGIRGSQPVTPDELKLARDNLTLSLPLRFEGISAQAAAVAGLLRDQLPLDYWDHFGANVDRVTAADVTAAANKYLDPDHMAIVVVGDSSQVSAKLRAANIAPVEVVDMQAKPVTKP